MRISDLAQAAAVTVDTIRFYEKRGLLNEAHFARQANGYRAYTDAALERLTLIAQAKAAGFTLAEIEALISAWESDALDRQAKQALFMGKIAEIQGRICELQKIQAYLEGKLSSTFA